MTRFQMATGVTQIAVACVLIGVSLPLVWRRIPMNHGYGIRIRKAFQSDELWYDINAYGGRQLILWCIPMILAGVACFFLPIDRYSKEPWGFLVNIGPMVVFPLIAIVRTCLYAARR